jgi:hypothetical protein
VLAGAGCDAKEAPQNPTWADVEPILRAECTGCHGATANATGGGFRFDFYDMAADPCGEAAKVLADVGMARSQASNIATAITTTDPDVRPRMPPLPAPYLSDEQWLTILRWTANPAKGDRPPANGAPRIRVDGTPVEAGATLDVRVVVDDPDGDPVIGVVKIGDRIAKMDRSGAFAATYDTSSWPAGTITMSAVICDGWSQVSADLLTISVKH